MSRQIEHIVYVGDTDSCSITVCTPCQCYRRNFTVQWIGTPLNGHPLWSPYMYIKQVTLHNQPVNGPHSLNKSQLRHNGQEPRSHMNSLCTKQPLNKGHPYITANIVFPQGWPLQRGSTLNIISSTHAHVRMCVSTYIHITSRMYIHVYIKHNLSKSREHFTYET